MFFSRMRLAFSELTDSVLAWVILWTLFAHCLGFITKLFIFNKKTHTDITPLIKPTLGRRLSSIKPHRTFPLIDSGRVSFLASGAGLHYYTTFFTVFSVLKSDWLSRVRYRCKIHRARAPVTASPRLICVLMRQTNKELFVLKMETEVVFFFLRILLMIYWLIVNY